MDRQPTTRLNFAKRGHQGEGGRLAGLLNSDGELKNMTMISNVILLRVEADRKNDFIRIINQRSIKITIKLRGIVLKKTESRVEDFPSIETLDVICKIAHHVKSI
jgi:hypothetical protein